MTFEQTLPPVEPAAEPVPPEDRTPWGYADMAMAIGIVIGSLVVISIPIIVIVSAFAGGNLEDGSDAERALEVGISFLLEGVLLLVAAMFSIGKYKLSWSALGLRTPERGGYWFQIPLFFAALAVFGAYVAIITALGVDAEGNVPEDAFDSTVLIVFLGVLSLGLAPFMEEVFFRGFLFGGLRGRWGLVGAAFASGLLFAAAHFSGLSTLPLLPVIGIIGILFAWGYYYTGSLFAPILAHFLFNLMSFLVGLLGATG